MIQPPRLDRGAGCEVEEQEGKDVTNDHGYCHGIEARTAFGISALARRLYIHLHALKARNKKTDEGRTF